VGKKRYNYTDYAASSSPLKKDTDRFTEKTFNLDFPDRRTIERTFLEMPEYGRVIISARVSSLFSVLSDLERTGFVGMRLMLIGSLNPVARLVAYKDGGGPCYDTGRTAQYKGGALAALDDDSHLLFGAGASQGTDDLEVPGILLGPTPICEKTAGIYLSAVYNGTLKVSSADPELNERLESEPVEFDCDTLDEHTEVLARFLDQGKQERLPSGEPFSAVLYPGPFRMLILEDGSMLSRGRVTLIKRSSARRLKKPDKCILFHVNDAADAEKARQFTEAYKANGTLCLFESPPFKNHVGESRDLNLGELDKAPAQTRNKLETLISRHDKYFVLTGSDPWDEYGCCPSREVGAANRLVEAGILTALSTATAPGACPTAFYAFSGEIVNTESSPKFTINERIRKQVSTYIKAMRKGPFAIVRSTIKWMLLLYVAAAISYMIINPSENVSMHSDLSRLNGSGVLIYYFHPAIRCAACLNMEAYTEKTLRLYYNKEMQAGSIALERVNIDDPENLKLVEQYGIFNTTIVMVKQTRGKVTKQIVLFEQLWELFDSENEFISMLNGELKALLENPDE
jgi:hypothetical protein